MTVYDDILRTLNREGAPPLSAAEIAEAVGRPVSTVRNALRTMVLTGDAKPLGYTYTGALRYGAIRGAGE